MAICIPAALPAAALLRAEGLEVHEREGAAGRTAPECVQIGIVNLMPTKQTTEAQILRLLAGAGRPVEAAFFAPLSHVCKNTPQEHIDAFYADLAQIERMQPDGLIVTGAPVEMLEFEQVDYWNELVRLMDHARAQIRSTLYICWAAQAALYHFFGVRKYPLPEKCFGVFAHRFTGAAHPLLRGMDEPFLAPHSRHTQVLCEEIERTPGLRLLAKSEAAGAYLAAEEDGRSVFVTGHSEYDAHTLRLEYERDRSRGLPIRVPVGYFPEDDPAKEPPLTWRAHSQQLYGSWLSELVCR
ncbi:MAG: homoserine O-succinyltransferase [Eubacteriales bacterium]|nr:homoserine O-succinyltransferase [Eubacteriales bacterium]